LVEAAQLLSSGGVLVGFADLPQTDPSCYVPPSCHINHAFLWDGGLHDLGALPGNGTSVASWIAPDGYVAGSSEIGVSDPFTTQPEQRAVLWSDGKLLDLGTLGGNESGSVGVNSSGAVTGIANNSIDDAFSFFGNQQTRAFLWRNGAMRDLGTLGGPDAFAQVINARGEIAGFSYTSNTAGPLGVPPVDPFLWDPASNKMIDLGGNGGTVGTIWGLNDAGEVIGTSDTPGDNGSSPFLWKNGQFTNLGTFGGFYGQPEWINENGAVVDWSLESDNATVSSGLWSNGTLTKLPKLPGHNCSFAKSINARGQVVGGAFENPVFCNGDDPANTSPDAWLYENGKVTNLNSLVAVNSPLHLFVGLDINDRGEIAGWGVPPGVPVADAGTNVHAFVLIPCAERPNDPACGQRAAGIGNNAQPVHARVGVASARVARHMHPMRSLSDLRSFIARRYHLGSKTP
jgi:probable HAF family extracellular repeat protein